MLLVNTWQTNVCRPRSGVRSLLLGTSGGTPPLLHSTNGGAIRGRTQLGGANATTTFRLPIAVLYETKMG